MTFRDDITGKKYNDSIENMIVMGEKLLEEATLESFLKALELFSKAAESGSKFGALRAAAVCTDLAPVYEQHGRIDDAMSMWNKGIKFSSASLPDSNENMDYFDASLSMMEQSLYGLASIRYLKGDARGAYDTIQLGNNDLPKNKVLKAVCMIDLDEYASKAGVNEAFRLLLDAYSANANYVSSESVGQSGQIEQNVLCIAASSFAQLLLTGKILNRDEELAKNILITAYNALTDEAAKNELLNVLS